MKHSLESGCDHLRVEARRGGEWTELAAFTGSQDWTLHELDLSGLEEAELRFRLTSDSSHSGEGVEIGLIEVGSFRHDPSPVRWGSLVEVLRNGTLPLVESLAAEERLPGALEIAAVCNPWSDLAGIQGAYRATRSWPTPPRPDAVSQLMWEAGSAPSLVDKLAQLPPSGAWRVLEFIRANQAEGKPLHGVSLEEAVGSYLQVAPNQVLVDDLDRVLELMLSRRASGIVEKESQVIVGGVVIRKN